MRLVQRPPRNGTFATPRLDLSSDERQGRRQQQPDDDERLALLGKECVTDTNVITRWRWCIGPWRRLKWIRGDNTAGDRCWDASQTKIPPSSTVSSTSSCRWCRWRSCLIANDNECCSSGAVYHSRYCGPRVRRCCYYMLCCCCFYYCCCCCFCCCQQGRKNGQSFRKFNFYRCIIWCFVVGSISASSYNVLRGFGLIEDIREMWEPDYYIKLHHVQQQQQQRQQKYHRYRQPHHDLHFILPDTAMSPLDIFQDRLRRYNASLSFINHDDRSSTNKTTTTATPINGSLIDGVWSGAQLQLQLSFPLHARPEEMENIVHPAYELMTALLIGGMGGEIPWPPDLSSNLSVPRFFEDVYGDRYFNGESSSSSFSIRQFLGDYGQKLPTPQQMASIGSRIPHPELPPGNFLETIYCSVTSYRDPECTDTVLDLYERARFPERIRVAIIDQRRQQDSSSVSTSSPNESHQSHQLPTNSTSNHTAADPICAPQPSEESCRANPQQTLCRFGHLIQRMEFDARYSCGPVFARHLAHRLYRGEYFAMQIDAHTRFTQDWDTDLIYFWTTARNEMAVLSFYPSDITNRIDPRTHRAKSSGRPVMCNSDYESEGEWRHLRHGVQMESFAVDPSQPVLQPFWGAGFSFARGHFVIQVPYDQHLPMVFQGEEISIGVRGFTYGYDYYAPQAGVLYHIYAIRENKVRRERVPHFWENNDIHQYGIVGLYAMKRLNAIIQMEDYPRRQWITTEDNKYGVGKIRSPQQFYTTFGIHTKEHRVEPRLCYFVLSHYRGMMKLFLPALREDGMGLDYSRISYTFQDPWIHFVPWIRRFKSYWNRVDRVVKSWTVGHNATTNATLELKQ